jgi:hypothetical protein
MPNKISTLVLHIFRIKSSSVSFLRFFFLIISNFTVSLHHSVPQIVSNAHNYSALMKQPLSQTLTEGAFSVAFHHNAIRTINIHFHTH